ncbi:ATP-binding protein [Rhizobium sp. S152]|uniref:sensor histidine kinase n=1 Tax=Rhizobium sp. S152 TaxID=3055038 RepID=UPI0025A93F9E|nr:ATP-binding protein [Rhizobium sp. S152]MDM9625405.1 ATP-binding protein [Rhizobium sp. S152]
MLLAENYILDHISGAENRSPTPGRLRSFIEALFLLSRRQTLSSFDLFPLWLLLFFPLALFAASSIQAAPAWPAKVLAVPPHFSGELSLDGFAEAAVGETNETTLSDMLGTRSGNFKPIAGHDFNMGFVQQSGWMRFAIRLADGRDAAQETLLLSLLPNFTDILNVFVAVDRPGLTAENFIRFDMGDHEPLPPYSLTGLDNIIPLTISSGDTLLVYVRAANIDSTLNLSARIFSPNDYDARSTVGPLVVGLWFGGMAILVIIQIVFFCLDRREFYLLLGLNIFGTILIYFGGLGLSRIFLFPAGGVGNDLFIGITDWLGLTAGALSIASVLDLRSRYPRLNHVFLLAALIGLLGVFFVLIGHNKLYTPIAGITIVVIATAAFLVTAIDFRAAKEIEGGLKLAAFALLWIGLFLTLGQRHGVIPLPNWVAQSYGLVSIVHFVLLTGSLAVRLRKAESAGRAADRRAVEAATAARKWASELVVERTAELVEARRMAELALQSELDAQAHQVRFMEVISHEYRTPLAIIRSNIESVRFTLPSNDDDNRARLERAAQGITRLVEVVEINLARSRMQGVSFKPRMERLSVSGLIDATLEHARDLLQGAKIRDEVSASARDAEIVGDNDMLILALINLLENAAKFSPSDRSVQLSVARNEDTVVVSVRDWGIGIPDEELELVKERATRGSNAAHIEGTGMGLSLVSRITAAHDGCFTLENAAGRGAVASIFLPSA